MSDRTHLFIVQKNVEHYQKLLEVLLDESARTVVAQLLREAESELAAGKDEKELAGPGPAIDEEQARRWRLKAEEYRATADICGHDAARDAYLRLAIDYERLADDAETLSATGKAPAKTP
jgi:hypothetical protein